MRKMSDDLRIKEIESLLDRYYKSEDSFEQAELAISIIQGHVGHLLNGFKQNKRYREALTFYAEKSNYDYDVKVDSIGYIGDQSDMKFYRLDSAILNDRGEKARQALEGEE